MYIKFSFFESIQCHVRFPVPVHVVIVHKGIDLHAYLLSEKIAKLFGIQMKMNSRRAAGCEIAWGGSGECGSTRESVSL